MIDSSGQTPLFRTDGIGNAKDRRLESTFFMINVIFLLLLFFVVEGNLNMNIEVSPPRADAEQEMSLTAAQLVVDAQGRLRFNGNDVELSALAGVVKGAVRLPELSISADAGVDAILVAKVIDALAGLDVGQVTLVTLGRAGDAPPAAAAR